MIIGNKDFEIGKRTYIMGILNVTPDSFSDGGRFNDISAAINRAKIMVAEGVDIIDIGGESTRPGHEDVSEEEEIKRVVPIIRELKKQLDIPISVDTYKGKVAELAIRAGADMINDIWGFKMDPYIAVVAAKYNVPCCLMHNRDNKNYKNLMQDIINDLGESIIIALDAGVKRENIILDPGIGFAKSYEDNLKTMNNLEKLKSLGYPVLLGTSRKSMLGIAQGLDTSERLEGTLATTTIGIMKGCEFIRVHDIKENKRVCVLTDVICKS